MAKGKKSSGKKYTSKGERSNVSRWVKLANRKEQKENPSVASIMQRENHIKRIISSPKNEAERKIRSRVLEAQTVASQAEELLKVYGEAGLTKAEAVQAIKTNYIPTLKNKWDAKLVTWKQANSAKKEKDSARGVRIVKVA